MIIIMKILTAITICFFIIVEIELMDRFGGYCEDADWSYAFLYFFEIMLIAILILLYMERLFI